MCKQIVPIVEATDKDGSKRIGFVVPSTYCKNYPGLVLIRHKDDQEPKEFYYPLENIEIL